MPALSFLPAPGTRWTEATAAYAIVAGTVFRDPGYALPDAKVVLLLRGDPSQKVQEAMTNYRGEFSFRVPPTQATYLVRAPSKAIAPEEKEAITHFGRGAHGSQPGPVSGEIK